MKKETRNQNTKNYFHTFFSLLRAAIKELVVHDPLLLSSSVAFFTLFSLPSILIILISVFGAVFQGEMVGKELFSNLTGTFGEGTAKQIAGITKNLRDLNNSPWITILGSVFLILVGTTTFSIVHKALNQIWQVKVKPKNNVVSFLKERGINLIIIFVTGILFLISVMTDVLVTMFNKWLVESFSFLIIVVGQAFSIIIVTLWFAMIFKFLPHVKLPWKPVWIGAAFTGLLFTIGEYVIRELLIKGNISTIYGAAGSVVLILLFIFYSSFILFYGAAFIKVYTSIFNYHVEPRHYAVGYEINELVKEDN